MKLTLLLKSFHAVAQAGTITGGARLIGVSQPTLSEQLAELERRFQVELFHRRGRRIAITPLGVQLHQTTRRMFELEAEAHALLGANASMLVGSLRIAAVGPYNVMRLLSGFCERQPRLGVQLMTGNSAMVLERVLEHEADLGLLVEAPADVRLDALPLRRQQLMLMAPTGHPLSLRRSVSLADIRDASFVVRDSGSTTQNVFERCLSEAGVAVRVRLRLESREAVREAVRLGLGLGVVSDAGFTPGPDVVAIPFSEPGMSTHAHLVWLESRADARLVRAFVEHSRGVMHAHPAPGDAGRRAPNRL